MMSDVMMYDLRELSAISYQLRAIELYSTLRIQNSHTTIRLNMPPDVFQQLCQCWNPYW